MDKGVFLLFYVYAPISSIRWLNINLNYTRRLPPLQLLPHAIIEVMQKYFGNNGATFENTVLSLKLNPDLSSFPPDLQNEENARKATGILCNNKEVRTKPFILQK